MVINEYKKKIETLKYELKRLKEAYQNPYSDDVDLDVSRQIIENQIKAHEDDIALNESYIDIYNKMIELIEIHENLSSTEQERNKRELNELKSRLPYDLADEIQEYVTEVAERKAQEESVISEIQNNIENNYSSYSNEYEEKEVSPKQENNKSSAKGSDEAFDLNNLDIELLKIYEEIKELKGKLDLISDSSEKDKIQSLIDQKTNDYEIIKQQLLTLLNEYKEKFEREYRDLNLVYEGEEILYRKYKDNSEKLAQISNRINEINSKKKTCFENQHKIEKLIKKYSSDNLKEDTKNNSEEKLLKIEKKEYKPKLTWKTVVSIAAGIGVGATVYFTTGPIGVAVLDAGAGLAKGFVAKKRHTSNIDYDKEKIKIKDISGMSDKLKASFTNLKTYLKSKEGLRDISWFLNSAIITGTSLSIGNGIKNFIASKSIPSTIENPIKEVPNNINPKVHPSHNSIYGDIKIQNGVGDYNVSSGYDKASWALNHTNRESLISEYVNKAKSVFNKFAILNPDGTIAAQCTTPGISIEQFAKSQGVDVSKVAVLVSDKLGSAQAWTATSELVKSIGAVK